MATKNRIFIAFAIEDKVYRDFLVQQARDERSPFEFVDMSVKMPWETDWESKVRTRIRGCDGVIALLSQSTVNATGARFEMSVAKEEKIPLLGVLVHSDQPQPFIIEVFGHQVIKWTWKGIAAFLNSL